MFVTALWLVSMVALALFVLISSTWGVKFNHEEGIVYDPSVPSMTPMGAWWAGVYMAAGLLGIGCPTVPFAIAMTTLGIAYFAAER